MTCLASSNRRVLLMANPRPFLIGAGRIVFLTGISISVAITSAVAQAGNTPSATAVADGDATVRADLAFDVVSIRPAPRYGFHVR